MIIVRNKCLFSSLIIIMNHDAQVNAAAVDHDDDDHHAIDEKKRNVR